jgi:hypothetical protein
MKLERVSNRWYGQEGNNLNEWVAFIVEDMTLKRVEANNQEMDVTKERDVT